MSGLKDVPGTRCKVLLLNGVPMKVFPWKKDSAVLCEAVGRRSRLQVLLYLNLAALGLGRCFEFCLLQFIAAITDGEDHADREAKRRTLKVEAWALELISFLRYTEELRPRCYKLAVLIVLLAGVQKEEEKAVNTSLAERLRALICNV